MTVLRLALAALALLLGLPRAALAQLWEARYDLTPAAYQRAYDELTPRGYVPFEISAIEDGRGSVRFSGVWRHEPAVAWEARSDLTGEELQGYFDRLTPLGYVPAQMTAYRIGGATRFAAVWRREAGVRWEARFGMTAARLQAVYDSLTPRGFVPAALSAYATAEGTRFAGIWRHRPEVAWEARSGLTAREFQGWYDRLTPQGYVPTEVAAYAEGGETRFLAVWERVAGLSWEARHDLSLETYLGFTRRMSGQGYAPYVITAYRGADGAVAYAGAWRFNAQPRRLADASTALRDRPVPSGTRAARLPIEPVRQQTLVWCWLAVGEMIFRHYGVRNVNPAGNFQCGIIGLISGPGSVCDRECGRCVMPSGSNYGTLAMLTNYARLAGGRTFRYAETRVLPPAAVVRELDAGRPVMAGISYTRRIFDADAEHVVLVVGYELRDGRLDLLVNDPYPYPPGQNPFLRSGGVTVRPYQYRIAYEDFRQRVFWHWSVHAMAM